MVAAKLGGGVFRRVRSHGTASFDRRWHPGFERPKIPGDGGAAEFVVEGGPPERAFDHDVEGRGDAVGLAVLLLPRLLGSGKFEVRDGETDQSGFGFGTATSGTFVANLAARTGGGPGVGRDRG